MSLSVKNAIDSLRAPRPDALTPVRIWLYVLALAILIMVALGGMTRLTDSGLSITSWKPIAGMIPPLSPHDWQVEFEAYKQIPEYKQQNFWMELSDFQAIFWWEWGHRFWGRVIGLIFAIPFLVFLVQRRLSWKLAPSLAVLFILGGFQGFLGWWMVSSGLSERVDVSQYRLAAHLGAASLLFVAILWVARTIKQKLPSEQRISISRGWQLGLVGLALMVFLQILMGAFVAGLDAGFGYNTWPLMDGRWIPEGMVTLKPLWLNLFENLLTVQFTHRMLGYTIGAASLVLLLIGMRTSSSMLKNWLQIIFLLILVQVMLGILTLLLVVPVSLALLHQAVAFILLGSIITAIVDVRGRVSSLD